MKIGSYRLRMPVRKSELAAVLYEAQRHRRQAAQVKVNIGGEQFLLLETFLPTILFQNTICIIGFGIAF